MASKKDFSGINTGRVYEAIEQATSQRAQQGTASPQEQARRRTEMKTQGRKGCELPRINMAFSPENHEFLTVMARVSGMSITNFANRIIAEYRESHSELFEQAQGIIKKI